MDIRYFQYPTAKILYFFHIARKKSKENSLSPANVFCHRKKEETRKIVTGLQHSTDAASGSVFVAAGLEPIDKLREVVEGAEARLEGLFGHGADFEIADEGGAVELAKQGFESDIDTDQTVIVVGVVLFGAVVGRQVGHGDTEADYVGFFLAFQLHEGHLGRVETIFVENDFESLALRLLEGDELPPVDVGSVVGELDDVAEEVEIALGTDDHGASLRGLFADFVGEAGAVAVELVLHLVEELLTLGVADIVHHGELLAIGEEPVPKLS